MDFETNGGEVGAWWKAQAEQFEDDVEDMLEQAVDETYRKNQQQVPVDTGQLKESYTKEHWGVYSSLDYAPHVGLGTIYMDAQPHLWEPGREAFKEAIIDFANGDL